MREEITVRALMHVRLTSLLAQSRLLLCCLRSLNLFMASLVLVTIVICRLEEALAMRVTDRVSAFSLFMF